MGLYIPCLNVDTKDSGSGYGVGAFINPANVGNLVGKYVLTQMLGDSALSFYLGPISILISIGINYEFWLNVFGLGETRIDREKEAIQDIYTPIFRYLSRSYGVPITDNHALNFPSDGVKKQFTRRPDIAELVDYTAQTDQYVANYVFGRSTPATGQEARVSNQFLANAAYNNWPVSATVQIWDAIVEAANPNCTENKERWIYNPEVIRTAAQMGALLRYIPLDVLQQYAAHNALGNVLANEVVLQWANNPDFVSQLPTNLTNAYSDMYQTFDGSYLADQDEYGNVIPLMGRAGWGNLVNTVEVKGPRYPDFADPGGQSIPSPGGTQSGGGGGTQGGGGGGGGTQGGGGGGTQGGGDGGTQGGGDGGTQGGGDGGTQGGGDGTQGGSTDQQRIDFNRACGIVYKLVTRQTISQADYDWILTNEGSTAVTDAYRDPDCNPSIYQTYDPDLPTTDDCPTVPGTTQGGGDGGGGTQGDGGDGGTQDDDGCTGPCGEAIDILKQKQEECCDQIETIIIPEIKIILEWLLSLEYRVPGPLPTLPDTPEPFTPPTDPGDKPQPTDGGGDTPTTPPPLSIPPELIDCLIRLCAQPPATTTEQPKERDLVCREIELCDDKGGPWGGMAECWLAKNTPNVDDVEGIFKDRGYPSYAVDQIQFAFSQTFQTIVGPQAQLSGLAPQGPTQGEKAQVWRFGADIVNKLVGAFQGSDYQAAGAEDQPIEQRNYIFADLTDTSVGKIRYVSVQPHDGEKDPCTGITQGTKEIPSA